MIVHKLKKRCFECECDFRTDFFKIMEYHISNEGKPIPLELLEELSNESI